VVPSDVFALVPAVGPVLVAVVGRFQLGMDLRAGRARLLEVRLASKPKASQMKSMAFAAGAFLSMADSLLRGGVGCEGNEMMGTT
jgi:hypothetical protein